MLLSHLRRDPQVAASAYVARAVGDPASVLSPDQHDEIWAIQKPLNFPLFVYGVDRAEADMVKITKRLAEALASHKHDAAKI
jgi:hypothetical protein